MSTSPESVSQLDNLLSEPDAGVLSVVGGTTGEFIVLGAGGKMGFHVCRMLQRSLEAAGRSYPIVAVSRFGDLPTRKKFEQAGFDVRAVDLSDRTQLSGLPDAANVINLAGVKFGTQGRPELLQRLNVEMPKLIAERYRDSRIVALSTGCVYSFVTPESGGSTEESRTEPSGAYARSCLGREQAFIDAAERWGTCSSLIRLNYSIDLRYGVLVDIAQKVLAGDPIELSMGYANIIWQRDAISHIIQTLPHSSASPFVINVTGPEIVRIRDVAKACGRRCGRDVTLTGSEAPTAWLSNAEKSHRLFGVPATSTEQMIEWTAAWLQRGGQTLGKPTHFETRDGEY
jgi:nucleoside-diphosphate-sugar epimerase